ncbi:N-acyl-D-aspartate/D-glutamate deacylase [Flavobacteriaceae bacterium MAR_2010_72]|nr:N-acyl-D-aspartate/D-glutamate deacylase [Flavobacteriaceae bacterium MAR_2010_72]TVZ58155.1 N-acyl-D-aspartate/D-glutamate deacylase [Flavobacteriaceae bacterium MAR_2010_105]
MKILKHSSTKFCISTVVFMIFILSSCKKEIHADILITNGTVFNGIDTIPKSTVIAIKGDKIIYLGENDSLNIKAAITIDASGLILAPGFIDPHTHADNDLVSQNESHNKPFLFQGVTTVVIGNDGSSLYPTSSNASLLESQGIGTNVVMLVGHGTIRKEVLGLNDKKATDKDIDKMKSLLQDEMDAGAFGMSTGLFYAPGSYSNTDEIIALAKVVSKNNGIYDTHLRDEGSFSVGLVSAIKEVIDIGRKASLPVHISHIKCLGVDVWHQSDSIINLIKNAQKDNIEITANQYPYEASATSLQAAVVPRWAESGGKDSLYLRYNSIPFKQNILNETRQNILRRGGPEKLLIVEYEDETIVGKNLLEVSKHLNISPEETVFELLKLGYVKVASFNMNPDDINNFIKQPWVVTGSDGGSGHPRKYGSFAKKYSTYVVKDRLIDISFFINNSSYKTAQIFKIPKRGLLKKGYYADVILFDPSAFMDKATYTGPFEFSEGLVYSIINGQIIIEKGIYTGKLAGRVLKK